MGDGSVVSGSLDSGCHKLSENIWFVWSKTSYGGDKLSPSKVEFWNGVWFLGKLLKLDVLQLYGFRKYMV